MRKLAVSLVFHVDETPAVLVATDLLAVNNNGLLRANNSKGDDALDLLVQLSAFLVVVLHTHRWGTGAGCGRQTPSAAPS